MTLIPIGPDLAHKWLNLDTYWVSECDEPPELLEATWREINQFNAGMPRLPRREEMIDLWQRIRDLEKIKKAQDLLPKQAEDFQRLNAEWSELMQENTLGPLPRTLKTYYPLDRRSALRKQALAAGLEETLLENLIARMRADVDHKNFFAARAKIDQLDKMCLALGTKLQTAEVESHMALVFLRLGEGTLALDYLNRSLQRFRFTDAHTEAVIRWIIGCLQWRNPLTTSEAIVNWHKSWERFASAKTERHWLIDSRSVALWYKVRAEEMAR